MKIIEDTGEELDCTLEDIIQALADLDWAIFHSGSTPDDLERKARLTKRRDEVEAGLALAIDLVKHMRGAKAKARNEMDLNLS